PLPGLLVRRCLVLPGLLIGLLTGLGRRVLGRRLLGGRLLGLALCGLRLLWAVDLLRATHRARLYLPPRALGLAVAADGRLVRHQSSVGSRVVPRRTTRRRALLHSATRSPAGS